MSVINTDDLVLTPSELAKRMEEYSECEDIETAHYRMDELMLEVLTALGYDKAVQIFRDTYKWYA